MITISEENPAKTWEQAVVVLYEKGHQVPENAFYRNECAALEVRDTSASNAHFSPFCPMPQNVITSISRYLVHGGIENEIDHEWTKIYRNRIFGASNMIDKIVALLEDWPDCPRAQISLWNPDLDYIRTNPAPCLQILWFKIINQRLDLHVHMRTTDCYGKLLMNINEFMALQRHVGDKLNMPTGSYCQFVDSLHFHTKDAININDLVTSIKQARVKSITGLK